MPASQLLDYVDMDTAKDRLSTGWIGTGVMGKSCCQHLLRAGYKLLVHTRTRDKAAALLEQGAQWCDSPAELAAGCELMFTMVGSPGEVSEVYFAANGLCSGLRAGSVLVDMGTTPPSLALEIQARASELGCQAIDAPVSGGDVGARDGTLAIMAGGDAQLIESLRPVFDQLGTVTRVGDCGSGQHTKMCNQITVAGTMIGVCEALLYARRAGLDTATLVSVIARGAAACWTLDNLAPRINRGDLEPGFMIDHFVKDLGIALEEARNMGLALPGTGLALNLYRELQSQGEGQRGTQALILALDKLNTQREHEHR